jgi:tellurite resistance protein TerC
MSVKRIFVAVVGGTILLFGIALLVLPGPAFLVIPIGLAVLATEFVWARRWLRRAKGMATSTRRAKRTTRAFRVTIGRRWARLRARVTGWLCKSGGRSAKGKPGSVGTGGASPVKTPAKPANPASSSATKRSD